MYNDRRRRSVLTLLLLLLPFPFPILNLILIRPSNLSSRLYICQRPLHRVSILVDSPKVVLRGPPSDPALRCEADSLCLTAAVERCRDFGLGHGATCQWSTAGVVARRRQGVAAAAATAAVGTGLKHVSQGRGADAGHCAAFVHEASDGSDGVRSRSDGDGSSGGSNTRRLELATECRARGALLELDGPSPLASLARAAHARMEHAQATAALQAPLAAGCDRWVWAGCACVRGCLDGLPVVVVAEAFAGVGREAEAWVGQEVGEGDASWRHGGSGGAVRGYQSAMTLECCSIGLCVIVLRVLCLVKVLRLA
jgi:hypothetical protein